MLAREGGQGSFLLSSKPRKHWTNWNIAPSSRAVSLRLISVISKASVADSAFEADFGVLDLESPALWRRGTVRLDGRHSHPDLTKFGTRDG
jgi:hypothetical protein